jgi:hypothetical protein
MKNTQKKYLLKQLINKYYDYFEEFIYRLPNPISKKQNFISSNDVEINLAKELKRNGIIAIKDFYQGDKLKEIKKAFENEINRINEISHDAIEIKKKTPVTHYKLFDYYNEISNDKKDKSIHNLNPLNVDKVFFDVILDDRIRSIISSYLGKKISLQQAALGRIYPRENENYSSYQWHRDTHGRRVNVMILLTDVLNNEQRMSFLKKSHKKFLTKDECANKSRITDAQADSMNLEIFECSGTAGTIFLFDANGVHRGNRNLSCIRDVILFSYGSGRYKWEFQISSKIKNNLTLTNDQKKFLENNVNVKWIQ